MNTETDCICHLTPWNIKIAKTTHGHITAKIYKMKGYSCLSMKGFEWRTKRRGEDD